MKLSLHYDGLPGRLQAFLNQFVPAKFESLPQLITDLKGNVSSASQLRGEAAESGEGSVSKSAGSGALSSNWRGTRLEVELPVN